MSIKTRACLGFLMILALADLYMLIVVLIILVEAWGWIGFLIWLGSLITGCLVGTKKVAPKLANWIKDCA